MWVDSMRSPMRTSVDEELGTMVENNHVTNYEPTSSTATTSQKSLKFSSKTPPAPAGPQIYMTWKSMTAQSTERSLLHSFRSEMIQRAVETVVCCQISRRLLVISKQGDFFSTSLDHKFQTSENPRHISENEQIRILLQRQRERADSR